MIRLFVSDTLAAGVEIALSDTQSRYLVVVMRQSVGAQVLVFNGCDGEWRAGLSQSNKRGCRLEVEVQTRSQVAPPDLELVVALVKRTRLETIVEKACELGVRRIQLLLTQRTNADHTNVARLQLIAEEAAEQTGRLDVAQVQSPMTLDALLNGWDEGRRLVFCDEAGDDPAAPWGGAQGRARPMLEAIGRADAAARPCAILIGPEGGFDPAERLRLRGLAEVTPVTLGPRILRADTAAISALTLWQAAQGDWRDAGDAP